MSEMRVLLALPALRAVFAEILMAAILACAISAVAAERASAGEAVAENPAIQLAAKIARVDAGRSIDKLELVVGYEKVYGEIDKVPPRWPALVRRALVCQQVDNQVCVQSSMQAIQRLGGVDSLALNHLFEVSRFGMSSEKIRAHLRDAQAQHADAVKPAASTPAESVAASIAAAPAVAHRIPSDESAPAVSNTPDPVVSLPRSPAVKNIEPKTLLQRGFAKLGKLGAADAAGFFLDALFIALAAALAFAYFLFSAMRGRRSERRGRLQALQEIQRLENSRLEEKVRADHEIWSEQLKSEVALEGQKTHAADLARLAQQAADEALQAERTRSAEALKAERLRVEQIIQADKSRLAEVTRAEQLKTEEAIKAAKYRADQAIDAYDQMAARELVYAHQHNDELQDQLNAERQLREAQELKATEALQALEAFKIKEKKLLDIIRAEQRVRASEARQAAEKLKAAQQAGVALQASLVAARALNADLECRADEAMRAAEARLADARRSNERPVLQGVQSGQNAGAPPVDSIALKDAHSV